MAGAFAGWWAKMSPYYTKAYQEMWVGVGVMTFLYYKVSYGGKKAAVDSSAHAVKSAPSHTAKPATSAAAAAAAAATATSLAVAAGDVTMSDILQRQHKNLVLEERKLYLEIEKLELEKAKLKSMK
ncbi:ATP synthase subunit ATP5MPL, mitochondrial [Alosa alosa]|nr:ATP synthase subunit ATP5MPL, mitochondrial [Alosa alosa]